MEFWILASILLRYNLINKKKINSPTIFYQFFFYFLLPLLLVFVHFFDNEILSFLGELKSLEAKNDFDQLVWMLCV